MDVLHTRPFPCSACASLVFFSVCLYLRACVERKTVSYIPGIRTRNLHLNNLKDINAIRVLVLMTYISAACLVFTLGVTSGVSRPDVTTCRAWIILCLVFYVLTKIEMWVNANDFTLHIAYQHQVHLPRGKSSRHSHASTPPLA